MALLYLCDYLSNPRIVHVVDAADADAAADAAADAGIDASVPPPVRVF